MKWETRALGDVVTLINGRAYSQHELLDKGTPVIRIQNLNGGNRWYYSNLVLPDDKYCEDGDLLFAWSASFGPYLWRGPKAIYHYHIWKIVPGEHTDRGFMYFLLQWLTESIRAASRGIGMLHMTKEAMEKWIVAMPPLPDQKRIAVRLREQLAEVEKARQALRSQLEAAEKIHAAVVGDRLASSEAANYAEQRLDQLARLGRGRFSPRPRNDPRYYNGEYPFIQTGDIAVDTGVITKHKQTLNKEGLKVSKLFQAGTLVISIAANIGLVGILGFDACMPDSLVGIQGFQDKAENRFLYYSLLWKRPDLQALAPQMAQANLSLALLKTVRLRVPSLAEQVKLVDFLDASRTASLQQKALIESRLEAVEKLPAALLREVFGRNQFSL